MPLRDPVARAKYQKGRRDADLDKARADGRAKMKTFRGEPGSEKRRAYNERIQAARKARRSAKALAEMEARRAVQAMKTARDEHRGYAGEINLQAVA